MRHIVFFAMLGILVISCHDKTSKSKKPNVLLINIDDLGWKDVGYMGSDYYETPNIDNLAAQGMIFSNGYAAAANCAPSRACLMSGKWTPRHGIYTVGNSERGASEDRKLIPIPNQTTLSKDHMVIPEILQNNGYATCHAGKWHLSENPLEYGFEINIAGGHNGHPNSYYPPYKNVAIEGTDDQHLTDVIMDKALTFVDTVRQPFFLYYSPYAVHTPIQPVQNLLGKYQDKPIRNGQNNPEYATMVENLDKNIGLLISKLKEKKLYKNTFIIFTSDNGGLYGITKQKPLRAGKGSYYEGGIREPFFFVLNGMVAANSQSDFPIVNLDLFPTIMHYAGIKNYPSQVDGINLSPILEGKSNPGSRALFWHFPIYLQAYNPNENENRDSLFRTRPGSVIRYEKWKLHYYFENGDIELYNLDDDIGETNNLAHNYPKKVDELLTELQNWWKTNEAPIPKEINAEYKQ